MFRKALQTVLFILESFGRPLPLPVPSSRTILRTTKAELVTFCGQFLPRSRSIVKILHSKTMFYCFENIVLFCGGLFHDIAHKSYLPSSLQRLLEAN